MERLRIGDKRMDGSETKRLSDVAGAYTYFAEGDVLLAKITPCFENGKLGIASGLSNGVGFGSSEFIVIRPGEGLDRDWLYYFLSRDEFRDQGAARMMGSVGHKRVAKEFIASYPIPIPPLHEQRRIVALLDEAFAGIASAKAHAERNLKNARALFESHLHETFISCGNGWVERRLEEVVAEDCSLSYGIVQPGNEVEDGLPVVRPTDLTNDTVRIDGLKRIDPMRAKSYRRTSLQGEELLLCVRGTTGVISKAGQELAGANVTRGIAPIRFNKKFITQGFGFHLLRAGRVQAQIRKKTYGTALMQINISDLRKILLAFPPVAEQNAITKRLDTLLAETQRLESIHQRKLAVLDELKQSLLHQAFSGAL